MNISTFALAALGVGMVLCVLQSVWMAARILYLAKGLGLRDKFVSACVLAVWVLVLALVAKILHYIVVTPQV